ncbi:MAG: hypothetical protein ABIZ70_08990, partial [Gemmatimonadales bacterium]
MSIALLACAIAAIGPQASGSDTVAWPRRVESIVQRHLQRDHGKLWGVRLDTIPLFLGIGNRVFTSVDPQTPGFVSIGDGWWSGPLPGGIVISNTALSWANRRWAMMRLPLPEDPLE